MKTATGIAVLLLLASGAKAQIQKTKAAGAMSDDFAKAGIKALRAIQSDGHSISLESGMSAKVSDTIDDADATAQGKETAIVSALRTLQLRQETNNLSLQAQKALFEVGFEPKSGVLRDIELQQAWDKDPEHAALLNSKDFARVATCETGLESLLRGRRLGPIPEACQ